MSGLVFQWLSLLIRSRVNALSNRLIACLLAASVLACEDSGESYAIATGSPSSEPYGLMTRQGAELAVEQINRRGGVRSRRLTLVHFDDEASGAKAAVVAQEIVAADSILAVMGHANSTATVAAARVYDGHLAMVSPSASSPELTGLSSWAFRVIPNDSANGQDLARFAASLGHTKAAILYENNSYGRGLADAFRRAFRGEIIAIDPVSVDGQEVEPYLAYLRLHNPGLIFAAGSEASGLGILREARRQGLTADFLGGDGWLGVTSDTVASEGVFVATPFTTEDTRREVQAFLSAFRAKFGRDPNGFAALAYDATMVIAEAIQEVGGNRGAIRDYLASMNANRAHNGLTGTIYFDTTGDVAAKPLAMTRVRRGALIVHNGSRQ